MLVNFSRPASRLSSQTLNSAETVIDSSHNSRRRKNVVAVGRGGSGSVVGRAVGHEMDWIVV